MIFGEIKTESSLNGILSSSLVLYENKNIIKVKKGTIINKNLINLLLKNNIKLVTCAKLDDQDIEENKAVYEISKNILNTEQSNLTIQNPRQGRCNIISDINGLLVFDPEQLFLINSVTDEIGIASLKSYSYVKKNQVIASIKAIPFAINKEVLKKIIKTSNNCFKVLPFLKKNVHLIQSRNKITLEKVLEKTVDVTKKRLLNCGITKILEKKCNHEIKSLSLEIKKSIDENADLILVFGASAICDKNDVVPKSLKENNGKVIRLGMPVEPGNLILLGEIKNASKIISFIGMPGCARSPKENGVDWILWRIFCGLGVSNNNINYMGNGGLL